MAMLQALSRLRPSSARGRLIVAHYNHRLRGAESEEDESFVRGLANQLGLPCEVAGASPALEGRYVSEDAAREARYAFLIETAHAVGARYVAVGHTADDQAETILFRLLRGTGLTGITGMPAARPLSEAVTLVRPMLSVRREMVRAYLASLKQSFRTDSSNSDRRFARNRIRHETLPLLGETFGGDVVERLLQLGRQAEELLAPLRDQACRALDSGAVVSGSTILISDRIAQQPPGILREMFVELWRRQRWPRADMSYDRWQELVAMLIGGNTPARMFPGGIRVEKEGESLSVTRLM